MNGAAKADCHRRMSSAYGAVLQRVDPDRAQGFEPKAYAAVHDTTARELTNHLDRIGMSPDAFVSAEMVERFFIEFHRIALTAIAQTPRKDTP